GKHRRLQMAVVRKGTGHSHPDLLKGRKRIPRRVMLDIDRADFQQALALPVSPYLLGHLVAKGGEKRPLWLQGFGRRNSLRHGKLMLEARLVDMEGCGKGKDGLTVLDRVHAPSGKAAAVADAVHFVDDGNGGIARQYEIAMQRMHMAIRAHRALRSHQCLPDHLPAEDALPAHLRAEAAKEVVFQPFQIQYVEKFLHRGRHGEGPPVDLQRSDKPEDWL